jgi:hypothetical protein
VPPSAGHRLSSGTGSVTLESRGRPADPA